MQPYPMAIRRQIIAKYQRGLDTADIAEDYGYCVAGVRRIRQRYEQTGSLEPLVGKVGRKPKFDPPTLERMRQEITKRQDITLAELREVIGIQVDLATYCRAIKKLGLTRKKSRSLPKSKIVRT
jgi:transposase